MKTLLALLLSSASLLLAQTTESTPKPVVVKRLASVTWDLDTQKLVWIVQKGAVVNGEFVPSSSDKYEVSPEEASMASKDEKRDLGSEDAGSFTDLINLLSLYCAQSTDWWENGSPAEDPAAAQPEPKSTDAKPETKKAAPLTEKPTRVVAPEQKQSPLHLPGTLVAANSISGK